MNFEELGISVENANALKTLEIITPTPVQEKAIPAILENKHVMAQAKTGTGKTLAYILPIIEKLTYQNNEALVLVPTRELAKQVHDVVVELGNDKVKSFPIYGGVSINNQINKLNEGIHIIIGTPGRLIDLYKRRRLRLNALRFVVADEADRMFDMGFAPDVKYILNQIKSNYQFLLFSATLYSDIREMVSKFTKNNFTFLNLSRDELTVHNTLQFYYMIKFFKEKFKTFLTVLRREKPETALVFVNTKKTADWLFKKLRSLKGGPRYKLGIISGNLSQFQREKILQQFRDHDIDILIATDVAARGLDIENISHVFNYDVPQYPENYVHRIGRTSRMNKKGVAITLCLEDEYEYLCHIEGLIDKEIKRRYLSGGRKQQQQQRSRVPFF